MGLLIQRQGSDSLEEVHSREDLEKALPKQGEEGGHKSPPKGYPESKKEYGDPENFKYPLDTEKHVRAAISYFSKPKNAGTYSTEGQKAVWARIRRAAKKYGIEVSEQSGPPSVEKADQLQSHPTEGGQLVGTGLVKGIPGKPESKSYDDVMKSWMTPGQTQETRVQDGMTDQEMAKAEADARARKDPLNKNMLAGFQANPEDEANKSVQRLEKADPNADLPDTSMEESQRAPMAPGDHSGLDSLESFLSKAEQMSLFGNKAPKAPKKGGGVVAIGKRGGKIYGYDSKGQPIYSKKEAEQAQAAKQGQAAKKPSTAQSGKDLTPENLLAFLKEKPGTTITVGELAYAFNKTSSSVTKMLDGMVKQGKLEVQGKTKGRTAAYGIPGVEPKGPAKTEREKAKEFAAQAAKNKEALGDLGILPSDKKLEEEAKKKGIQVSSAVSSNVPGVVVVATQDGKVLLGESKNYDNKGNLTGRTKDITDVHEMAFHLASVKYSPESLENMGISDEVVTKVNAAMAEFAGEPKAKVSPAADLATKTTERAKMKFTETATPESVKENLRQMFTNLVGGRFGTVTDKGRMPSYKEAQKALTQAKLQARRMSPKDRNEVIAMVKGYWHDAQKYAKRLQQAGSNHLMSGRDIRDLLDGYRKAMDTDKKELNKPNRGKYTTNKPDTPGMSEMAEVKDKLKRLLGSENQKYLPEDLDAEIKSVYQEVVATNKDRAEWKDAELGSVLYKTALIIGKNTVDTTPEIQKQIEAGKAKQEAAKKKAEEAKPKAVDSVEDTKHGPAFKMGDTLKFGRREFEVVGIKKAKDWDGKDQWHVELKTVGGTGGKVWDARLGEYGWSGLPKNVYEDKHEMAGVTPEGAVPKAVRTGTPVKWKSSTGMSWKGYKVQSIRGNKVVVSRTTQEEIRHWQTGEVTGTRERTDTQTFTWDGSGYKRSGAYLVLDEGAAKSMTPIEALENFANSKIEKSRTMEEAMNAIEKLAAYGLDPEEEAEIKKSQEDLGIDLEKAQSMPSGGPKQGLGQGEEQGGNVAGVGQTSGTNDAGGGQAKASPDKKEKLSEDDEEDEAQMKEHKKPIETTKSMTSPQGQRDQVAHENAQVVAQLRKGQEDVVVGVGVPTPAPEPEVMEKSQIGTQGADSLVVYSNRADLEAERLLKSDQFYVNGSPTIPRDSVIAYQQVQCPACQATMQKSLSVCPSCGHGAIQPRVLPTEAERVNLEKANGPMLRRPKPEKDLILVPMSEDNE